MKKSFFVLLIAVFLGSCQGEFDDVIYTITNDSSKAVSFLFNDIWETLNDGGSITYAINSQKGIFAPKDFTKGHHPRSLKLTRLNKGAAGIFYTFSDNAPLSLNVKNNLETPVTVKADNYISGSEDTGVGAFNDELFTLTIKENNCEKASIYTSSPYFTIEIEASYEPFQSPVIEWELKDAVIYVIIYKRF